MAKYSQKSIEGKVLRQIKDNHLIQAGDKIGVAVSGGADSVALLLVLTALKERLKTKIIVLHFNHRLRGGESDQDQQFVEKLCQNLGIECRVGQAERENEYKNEEEARNARYSFFFKNFEEGRVDKIAIAHNLNDQAETYLMRLIRGSGLSGLSSIPVSRQNFIRPLLSISRAEILQYLSTNNQSFRTDSSNLVPNYLRNKIRLQILPMLEEINPNIIRTLSQNAKNAEQDYFLLKNLAEEKLKKITIKSDAKSVILSYKDWLSLPQSQKSLVIRLAIEEIDNLIDITSVQIDEAIKVLEKGVGKKHKLLPHSLRLELQDGKILILKS